MTSSLFDSKIYCGGVTAVTSINDIADLVRIIKEQPEWADTLRSILLGQELLELPAQFAGFVELTNRNFQLVNERFEQIERRLDLIEARLDQIERRLDLLEGRLNQVEGKLDNAIGMNYQLKVEKNIGSIAGQYLQIRRVKVLQWSRSDSDSELMETIYQAEDDGTITGEQFDDLGRTDLIFTGQAKSSRAGVQVAAEVSITIGDDDITRAARRSRILETITGQPVIPAVIGARIDDARTELANANGVAIALEPDTY